MVLVQLKSKRKVQRSWAMYDWANSAYNLVITSTIFPAYYEEITSSRNDKGQLINDSVQFLGFSIKNSVLMEFAIAAAYLLIVLLSPILSSVADYKGNKKAFMQFFCYLGSLACCGLYFFTAATLTPAIFLFILAAIGYCGSIVFYNAYLPEIALEDERDALSAKGFSYGYIGSVILQVICLLFVLKPDWFHIKDGTFAPRLSFLLVGIWWMGFAQITFRGLPDGTALRQREGKGSLLAHGFMELKKVARQINQDARLKLYLAAFFFYSMGVQTVMLAATLFGKKEIHKADGSSLGTPELIITILLIQIVAIGGAWLMARISGRLGNLKTLLIVVFLWIVICVAAFYTYTETQFYFLAVAVGLVMGGIQSLSRSTYSKLMPVTRDTASFFSFYDVMEKLGIVLGMLTFGIIDQLFTMRYSIISLISFFAIGLCLLLVTNSKQNKLTS